MALLIFTNCFIKSAPGGQETLLVKLAVGTAVSPAPSPAWHTVGIQIILAEGMNEGMNE